MVMSTWLQNAKENLLPLSDSNEFMIAKKEWMYVGLMDNEDANFNCELCWHPAIRYEYTIQNRLNQNQMIVGSSCIEKFIDQLAETQDNFYDINNEIVDKSRLDGDKQNYWTDILFRSLENNFSNTEFQKSITEQIKVDGHLTINQAKFLRHFYDKLNDNEQMAFKYIVSIKLRKDKQKEQYTALRGSDKAFIDMLLSPQQRNIINEL